MVEGGIVVWLLVVPGMVVGGTVVPDSTEVTVVLTGPVLVLLPEEVDPVAAVEALEAEDEAAEAAEEARLSTLLTTDEISERMLEAAELAAPAADEIAADTEAPTPVSVVDWPRTSPERRPRAITARVWAFILYLLWCFLNDWILSLACLARERKKKGM